MPAPAFTAAVTELAGDTAAAADRFAVAVPGARVRAQYLGLVAGT